jgi:hypothetical protein
MCEITKIFLVNVGEVSAKITNVKGGLVKFPHYFYLGLLFDFVLLFFGETSLKISELSPVLKYSLKLQKLSI